MLQEVPKIIFEGRGNRNEKDLIVYFGFDAAF